MPHEIYRTEKKVNHQIRELIRHVSVDWKVGQKKAALMTHGGTKI